MAESRIVVIGAGVSGLTTALLLSRSPDNYHITVTAKFMPGDYDIEYASPWAGANYLPVSAKGSNAQIWDQNTWPELERLARSHPEAGIHFQEMSLYIPSKTRPPSSGSSGKEQEVVEPWFKNLLPNFRRIPEEELRASAAAGFSFTSVCINTSIYLPWLVSQCLKAGVIFRRRIFRHISEAAYAHHSGREAHLIVNCTGLSAGKLGGVEDAEMTPARGQTVLVRDDPGIMADVELKEKEEERTYIMQRAAGGGTLIGGCYQIGNWDSQVDYSLANRILKRAVDICPTLTGGKGIEHLSIIRHGVGLRPLRLSGTRIEKEKVDGVWVVHNYGHGGFGYQSSYGCSQNVVKLVEEALASRSKL